MYTKLFSICGLDQERYIIEVLSTKTIHLLSMYSLSQYSGTTDSLSLLWIEDLTV